MHSHGKSLVSSHRPVYKPRVMPVDEAAGGLLQADNNAPEMDDAVVVEMSGLDGDVEYENDAPERTAQPGRRGAAWKVLGGVGAVAGMLGLYGYLWPRSFVEDLPDDERDVLEKLNQSRISPTESRSDYSSGVNEEIPGKWLLRYGLVGKALFAAQILGRVLPDSGWQAQPQLGTELPRSLLPTNTSSNLFPGTSSSGVVGQMAFGAAATTTDENTHDGVWGEIDADMTKEMARIDTLVIRDLAFLFEAGRGNAAGRRKRGAAASGRKTIDDRQIEKTVRHVFKGKDLSKALLQLGQHVIARVAADEEVAAADPAQRPVLFYVATLEVVIAALKLHVKNNEINAIYHFLYSRLIQLRSIEEWFSSHRTAERVEIYNQRLRAENEAVLKPQSLLPEQNEVDVFLKSKHHYWYEKGLRSAAKIAIHRERSTDIFSLSDMFDQQHVDANGNALMGKYAFLFDSSGLAYGQESGEIFRSMNNGQFAQFKLEETYQDYISERANALFQERLGAPQTHLLYLDRKALVEGVLDSLERTPLLATASGNKDLKQAMGNLSSAKQHWNATQTATNVYAQSKIGELDAQLFEGMDILQVLSSDYRYCHRNDIGEEYCDTALLSEILSKGNGAENIEIAQLHDAHVHFPPEFSAELKAALLEIMPQVDMFWKQAQRDIALNQLRLDLEGEMPSLSARMLKRNDEICQLMGMSAKDCSLRNEFSFSYDLLGYKPIEKTLTMGQILLGEVRKLDAEYSARTRRMIAFPAHANNERNATFSRYIRHANNQDMQEQISKSLNELGKNQDVKNRFNQYVMDLTSKIPGKHVETSELVSSPLLRIIRTRIPTTSGTEAQKSYVLSILTGDIYPFDNNFYAINAMQRERSSIANLDAHFLIGEREKYDRKLRTGEKLDQHFERVLQHQKDNVDKLFTSIAEGHMLGVLELLSDLGPYVIEALIPNPLLNTVLSAVISSGAKAAQGLILTEDHARLNQIALRNFVKSIAGSIAGPTSGKVSQQLLRTETKKISEDFSQLFKSGKGRLVSEKIGEKGASYSIDGLVDWAVDYFVGKVPDATLIAVPDFMLTMEKTIDLTGSFQLYKSLSDNTSSQPVPEG